MRNTKVLFVALKFDYGIKERGESLEKKVFLPALQENIERVDSFWLEDHGFPNNISGLQNEIINYTDKQRPDIIFFILMSNEVSVQTLDYLKGKYITINWFGDDQWRFNSFTRFVAPHFTYAITVDKYSLPLYKEIGCENVILAQWAAIRYEKINLDTVQYKYDVSFIGSKNPTREWIVKELKKTNIHVNCFGTGWEEGRISFEQMKDIFFNTKINLNLSNSLPLDYRFRFFILKNLCKIPYSRKSFVAYKKYLSALKYLLCTLKTTEQIKARNFEIPGFGGFMLSQFALSLEDYYVIGKDIAVFSNIEELVRQIRYYMDNAEEREQVKRNGYLKSRNYTYSHYIGLIFDKVLKTE